MLREDPRQTLVTLLAALSVRLLPRSLYNWIVQRRAALARAVAGA
jgi:hypothetical protein